MLSDSNLKDMKKCSQCKDEKQIEMFCKNKNLRDGLNSICKECGKYNAKKYRLGTDNNARARLKYLYGISMETYQELFKAQGGKCGICETDKDPLGRRFALDHCHETGKIRGLLCFSCNTGIGKLKSVELLKKAVKYLQDVI